MTVYHGYHTSETRNLSLGRSITLNLTINRQNVQRFIHLGFHTAYPTQSRGVPGVYPRGLGAQSGGLHRTGCQPTAGHTCTHYGQFGDVDQPITHVFGLGEETPDAQGEHSSSAHT